MRSILGLEKREWNRHSRNKKVKHTINLNNKGKWKI